VLLCFFASYYLKCNDLQEMIFRGTDTTALLTEWCMAELVRHPSEQSRIRAEVNATVVAGGHITDADVARMPYLQAVVKETLRLHPPGPLLSWARLATADVALSNGMVVPAGTTAMVNMWSITHDAAVWADPESFAPGRFLPAEGGADVDVRGGDLRLAPFGAGRRVCPGKNLGLVTVGLWVARLVQAFEWALPASAPPVCLDEVLKLSLEMKTPLVAAAVPRSAAA
jgi:cytochrome P450 family 78 subfamily A